jgi:hypothetical protein
MAPKALVFTVDRGDTAGAAERLRSAGVSVSRVLHGIGVIDGSADEADLEKLRAIPGVLGVEPSRDVYVGPPDSPIQ